MDAFLLFKIIAAAVIGLCVGSYLAALLYRLPRGVKTSRSACPSCGHALAARDLVPVISWLFLRGRCRYCAARISGRYALIEILTAATFVALLLVFEN